ncbi:MAG: hypothetical protein EA377_09515 [Phycisphaerales bacterium]|nr:MAG: hypothetical protein EA377_09515 [Phycisphaerales bacterium]
MTWRLFGLSIPLLAMIGAGFLTTGDDSSPARPLTGDRAVDEIIRELLEENRTLRTQLADARLEAEIAQRELEELRQFILDHHEYGRDFEAYRSLRELREREAQQRAYQRRQERRAEERARREEQRRAAQDEKREREQLEHESRKYREAGFQPLGFDVFAGRMAYHYRALDAERTQLLYDPFLGFYHTPQPRDEVDYSTMTISGSIVNASREVRNIGVAITFFDQHGNQIGHEIIQVNNARPDVPYPFTSRVDMAAGRPFESSSTYVLYADPVPAN